MNDMTVIVRNGRLIWIAPSGLPSMDVSCPRALPWAGMGQAVGLHGHPAPSRSVGLLGQPMSALGNALGYGETTGSQAADHFRDVTKLSTHGKGGHHFMSAMPPGHATLPAPKGQPMSALGNALGYVAHMISSPERAA